MLVDEPASLTMAAGSKCRLGIDYKFDDIECR